MNTSNVNYAIIVGLSIMLFAVGVVFATNGAPAFAAFIGSTVIEAATMWFIFGAGVVIVGGLNYVRQT